MKLPIAPSVALLGAGAREVDVAARSRDLQTVLLAEDGRMQLLDADVTRRLGQVDRLHGVLHVTRRAAQQRLVRARRTQSRQSVSVQSGSFKNRVIIPYCCSLNPDRSINIPFWTHIDRSIIINHLDQLTKLI